MKSFKNILLSVILVLTVVFGVVACGGTQTAPPAPTTYEVYFETFGYCEVESQEIEEGNVATRPTPDPTCATHNFGGWYTDMSYTTEFDFTTPITQDIDLYAKWTEKESTYTITFDRNGHGKAPANQYIEAGTDGKITKPNDLTASGWKFVGWSLDKGDGNLINFDSFIPTSSLTLYAQWLQMFTVSFDLNNDEALIAPPESQSIEDGSKAIKPEDPIVIGFKFDGWYTDKECTQLFDFNTPITKRTTLYAEWIDNTVGFIDGSDLPAYEWEKNAAYGERPDLEGYRIDGEIGEKEEWNTQTYYTQAITSAPSVTMQVTTIFSEKGLYVFGKAKDNGGVFWTGINYHFKNTSWTFYIMGENVSAYNVFEVPKVEIDTRNVFPSWVNVRGASKVIGEINSTNHDNRYAEMNVEFFMTWQDLRIDTSNGIPEKVYIYPSYNYKRLEGANFTYNLLPTFSNTNKNIEQKLSHFLEFNANGFADVSDDDSILGDTSYGIAKSRGWEIENNEAESLEKGERVVFFKDVTGAYYQFSTEMTLTGDVQTGNAGVTIFNSEQNYTSLRFDINTLTYQQGNGFVIARPKIFTTNKDGGLDRTILDDIQIADGKLKIRTVFANGYVFYIVNGRLINCQLVADLNERTSPGLMTYNVEGVRFINNSVEVLDAQRAKDVTSEFAYIISKDKTESITMSFNTVGVTNEADNELIMYYQNSRVGITNAQKTRIVENSDFSGVMIRQIESVKATTNAGTTDITEDFKSNAKYGKYVIRGITADTQYSSTSSVVPIEDLVFKQFKIYDSTTKKPIPVSATAIIKSSNPTLGYYDMLITGSDAVLVLVKGYDYEVTIEAIGYRNYSFNLFENVTENECMEPIYMVANIVGGTAVDEEGTMTFASNVANWDMSTESLGYISMETVNTSFSSVYFSGVTIDEYQVMEISVANTINTGLSSVYEANPGAGFMFVDSRNRYSWIELAGSRIRVLQTNAGWSPDYYNIPGSKGTVNILPTDPDDPNTFHYTKFTIIKINSMCYCYVNDEFVLAVELYNLKGKCGVALSGHSSYYLSMRYKDYWIKTGNEALEYALSKVAVVPVMDDTCYDFDYNTGETDFAKPYIEIDGLISVGDGENRKDASFIGQSITISLTEHVMSNLAYTVLVGSEKIVLTILNPSVEIQLDNIIAGELKIQVVQSFAYMLSGTVFKPDGTPAGGAICSAVSEDGSITVNFTAGEDGTFTAGLPKGVFVINALLDGYVCQKSAVNVTENVSDYNIHLLKSPIGGKVNGGGQVSSEGLEMGYDYTDATTSVSGVYGLINTKRDAKYAFNEGLMKDFVIEYSYVRKEVVGTANETNPAVGIAVYTNGTMEALTFYTGAVRIIPSGGTWADRINVVGRGNYNLQSYNEQTDFRIARRSNIYYMYFKHPLDSDYKLVYTYESLGDDAASEVFLQNTCAASNRFLVFNIKVTRFDDTNIPDFLQRSVTVDNKTPSLGSVVIEGGAQTQDGTVYAVGDQITLSLKPQDGYSVAYVKVNGKFVSYENNLCRFTVGTDDVSVELVFEVTPVPVTVKGKVQANGEFESVIIEFVDVLGVVEKTIEAKADGSFETIINSGTYTVRPIISGYACENKLVNLTESVNEISLNAVKNILGGKLAGGVFNSSNGTFGYNYTSDSLNIDGYYVESTLCNSSYVFHERKYTDFVYDFSHIRLEVPGVTNETNPTIGLTLNNGGKNESVGFYAGAVRIIPAGKTWNDRINVAGVGSYNVQLYNNRIDFRIIRKNNVLYLYYKSPAESEYKFAYKYQSGLDVGAVELKTWNSSSSAVHYFLYNINIREIGANEFTDLP